MKILIIDDHELFSEGLRLIIEAINTDLEFDIKIVQSEISAKEVTDKNDIDLILLDYYLPGVDSELFFSLLSKGLITFAATN